MRVRRKSDESLIRSKCPVTSAFLREGSDPAAGTAPGGKQKAEGRVVAHAKQSKTHATQKREPFFLFFFEEKEKIIKKGKETVAPKKEISRPIKDQRRRRRAMAKSWTGTRFKLGKGPRRRTRSFRRHRHASLAHAPPREKSRASSPFSESFAAHCQELPPSRSRKFSRLPHMCTESVSESLTSTCE